MKKTSLLLPIILLLSACSNNLPNSSYQKNNGNNNFEMDGNLIVPDYKIDGVLDPEDYKEASLSIHMGGREDFETEVTGYLVFGNNGLLVGFYSKDKFLSSSTDYTDPQFVVNSDNVEFYIDTLNNKGKKAQSDDYAFLINPEEFIEMRNGTGSYWSGYSGVVDYAVKVEGTINNDSDIDTGWGCEIYLPYQAFGFDKESTIAVAFGCRDKKSFEQTSKWTGWGPDPQIINTYISLNKNGVIQEVVKDLTLNNGSFEYKDNEYNAVTENALGTLKNVKMSEGTFTVDMYLSFVGNMYDNGITIQVDSAADLFWEGINTSYYFFCITHDGNALLGQSKDGEWIELAYKEDVNYKLKDWNTLKIILANSYLTCYLGEEYLFAAPVAKLKDLPFGLRAGMKGIKYKNITYSDSTDGAYVGIDGYHPVWGDFEYVEDSHSLIKSSQIEENGAMIVSNNELGEAATIETNMKAASYSDNGIVFKLDDNNKSHFWENEVSYYFFFISMDGTSYLGRVLNGQWTNMSTKPISGYDINQTYILRVEYTKTNIKCYINNTLRIDVNDSSLSGAKYGFRAGNVDTTFSI